VSGGSGGDGDGGDGDGGGGGIGKPLHSMGLTVGVFCDTYLHLPRASGLQAAVVTLGLIVS
jgi:hypothetical protein